MNRIGFAIAALLGVAAAAPAQTVLFSDAFSRTIGEAPTTDPGDPLNTDWGPNDNALGGTISQTYQVSNQHVDSTSGWRSGALVDGAKGQLGYAHAEVQHNWATDAAVLAAGRMTVEFDLILAGGAGGGHIGWWFGTADSVFEEATGAAGGGTPVSNANVDASVFFRVGGGTGGSFDSGVAVNNTFNIVPAMSTTAANQVRLEVVTGDFQSGAPGSVSLFLNGSATPIDINGAAAGNDVDFVWDAEGAAYMGFSRNSSPTLLSIDNLRISVPTAAATPGDYNADGAVNAADYSVWRDNLGGAASALNGAGSGAATVVPADYDRWVANYGVGASSATAIPEPAAIAALAMCLAATALLRNRCDAKATCR
ncbi:MAG: hypothetical protein ACRCT8_11765 [Lacipirellulaceae bacterium]